MKLKNLVKAAPIACGCLMLLNGCASPEPGGDSITIPVDKEPLKAGINSSDIRTVATQMCPEILAVPEIADAQGLVRIKIAGFENKSRFFIDRDIFMNRLVTELNKHGRHKVRFLSENQKVQISRAAVIKDRQSKLLQENLKVIASEIAASPVANTGKPIKVAVIPVLNTNLVNMNADSFTAMLRSEIFNASAGRIQFLMPGVIEGADYYLTGQFIPETMKTEGIINLAEYIKVIDARVKAGQSIYITSNMASGTNTQVTSVQSGNVTTTTITPGTSGTILYENHIKKILDDPAMRANPNVNKRLNIMLVNAKEKLSVYEKMIMIDRKISDNSGAADYIISGNISGMHLRRNGIASDYLLISVQLTNPETNEIIWEDSYEVKRLSSSGIVYR